MLQLLHFRNSNSNNTSLSLITRSGVLIALVAVFAQIAIPLPFTPVPITLQTLGFLLIAGLLPPIAAGLSAATYLLLGMVGVPVFAHFSGGFASLVGPTGGFLLGFIPATFVLSLILESKPELSKLRLIMGVIAFQSILYLAGCGWFALITQSSMTKAFLLCVAPFLLGDFAKAVLFLVLYPKLRTVLTQS